MKFLKFVLFFVMFFVFLVVNAQSASESVWNQFRMGSTDDPDANIDEKLLPIQVGPFDIGGFFRYNFTHKDWDNTYDKPGQFALDVVGLNVDLTGLGPWKGSFQYRYYNPKHTDGYFYHFLHHAWLGYEFSDQDEVQVGVQQVPFGVLPFASHNWFFQLPYYVGLEDDYDLGIKYIMNRGPWNHQFAYYLADEGQYFGRSRDSSRYAYDVVKTDSSYSGITSSNEERNQLNYRIGYTYEHNENWTTELGGSFQYSQIHNVTSGDDGSHYAVAAHVNSNIGPYNLIAEAIRYEYNLKNPASEDSSYVAMGAFDYPYKVATRANIYTVGLSRDFDVNWGPITKVTVYDDYGIMVKDNSDYKATQHNVIGAALSAGRFVTYIDFFFGQNHPWAGGDWADSLASGDSDGSWNMRFNVNVGYYF